jgi:hypothetical protein
VGEGDRHYHAEAVVRNGWLQLYTLDENGGRAFEVDAQVMTAHVRPEKELTATTVLLMPVSQPRDAAGMTSRFLGKLPRNLWGRPAAVTVPSLAFGGSRFLLDFALPGVAAETELVAWAEEESNLYRQVRGKYTAADIQANGEQSASQKFAVFAADHDRKSRAGERVCPVTRLAANPACSWTVDGQVYEFCCPPCVDEFVKTAKEQPGELKPPGTYVKK